MTALILIYLVIKPIGRLQENLPIEAGNQNISLNVIKIYKDNNWQDESYYYLSSASTDDSSSSPNYVHTGLSINLK